jgi:ABC-type dipeptide/oligopeptide/nickel transport system ATPase component
MPLLEVDRLTTAFPIEDRVVSAVSGVSFSLDAGETLALVGESGCGKSLTALSILRLVDPPGRIVGGAVPRRARLLTLDERAMRSVRGREIGLVLQEPMTALNPVYTVGSDCRSPR